MNPATSGNCMFYRKIKSMGTQKWHGQFRTFLLQLTYMYAWIYLYFNLFQDLCQLTNGEQPYWLIGIIEMTRTFGLELLESVLKGYPNIFLKVSCNKHMLQCNYSNWGHLKKFSTDLKNKNRGGYPTWPQICCLWNVQLDYKDHWKTTVNLYDFYLLRTLSVGLS